MENIIKHKTQNKTVIKYFCILVLIIFMNDAHGFLSICQNHNEIFLDSPHLHVYLILLLFAIQCPLKLYNITALRV